MLAVHKTLLTPAVASFSAVTIKSSNFTGNGSSVTIGSHVVGDIIVMGVYNNTNSVAPAPTASGTVPAWVDIDATSGAGGNSMRTVYYVATATNHTSGTWTGAQGLVACVLSGQSGSTPIGGHAQSGGTAAGNSAIAPSVTMDQTDGTSALLHFFGSQTFPTWGSAPAGYTKQPSGIGKSWICAVSKNSTTTDGSVTMPNSNGASVAYRGATVEIRSH